MSGMFFAEGTIFAKFNSVGRVLFVLVNVIISLLTFGASKSYSNCITFCHFFNSILKN